MAGKRIIISGKVSDNVHSIGVCGIRVYLIQLLPVFSGYTNYVTSTLTDEDGNYNFNVVPSSITGVYPYIENFRVYIPYRPIYSSVGENEKRLLYGYAPLFINGKSEYDFVAKTDYTQSEVNASVTLRNYTCSGKVTKGAISVGGVDVVAYATRWYSVSRGGFIVSWEKEILYDKILAETKTSINPLYLGNFNISVPSQSCQIIIKDGSVDSKGQIIESFTPEDGYNYYFLPSWASVDDNPIISNKSNNNFEINYDNTFLVCLTTIVGSGSGSITQISGCDGVAKSPPNSCASDYTAGLKNIQLIATPDEDNGWEIDDWYMVDSSTNVLITGYFEQSTYGKQAVSITMPPFDVTVYVDFKHDGAVVKLENMTPSYGCIKLISPTGTYDNSCHRNNIEQTLPSLSSIVIGATPDEGYEISEWKINGASTGTVGDTISLTTISSDSYKLVQVWFQEKATCTSYNLTINVNGNGSVSPPSGSYCDYETKVLKPIPSSGYFFKGWEFPDGAGITRDGIRLIVPMISDREVTANFELLPDFETSDTTLFYCPSQVYKSSVISFDYTNSFDNPSNYDNFHFRVTFYADANKKKFIYSAFSFSDITRWFYDDSAYYKMPQEGVQIDSSETLNIIYNPEVSNYKTTESQSGYVIDRNGRIYESPLVCGVTYYVDVESYNPVTNQLSFVKTISIILDCDEIESNYWNYNTDDNNWICSGQGKNDLQVSSGVGASVFSDSSSNIFGMHQIVWSGKRNEKGGIYSAIWDSNNDVLFSSAQGASDSLKIARGYKPVILTDPASNFYISSYTRDSISVYACPFPIDFVDIPTEDTTTSFAKFCNPGLTSYLNSSYDSIKVRVYKDDISGSLVINDEKTVPVIDKQNIRLEVDGISGSYAVRLRNIDDAEWGGWININSSLYYNNNEVVNSDDFNYDAYSIDNSRFVVPWEINRINGMRRICCQVLTLYGITNTFCVDIFANFDISRHTFKFYSDSSFTNELPTYNGQYVLSIKDSNGLIKSYEEKSSTIYFKVIFNEPIYKNIAVSPFIPYDNGDIKFNMVQQGINDLFGGELININDKEFSGSFIIYKEDGVFNKDGNAFIELIFPDSSGKTTCLSDTSDRYNLMVSDAEAAKYKDLTPEEVYQRNLSKQVNKILDINEFKQYYSLDDNNFKFGNPEYFRE